MSLSIDVVRYIILPMRSEMMINDFFCRKYNEIADKCDIINNKYKNSLFKDKTQNNFRRMNEVIDRLVSD